MRAGLHWYSYMVFRNAIFTSSKAIIVKRSFQKLAWHVKGMLECMVLLIKPPHPMKLMINPWTSQVPVHGRYFSISARISSFMHIAVVMILLHHSFEKMGFSINYNTKTFLSDEVDPWTMLTVLLFSVVFCSSKGPSTVWSWQKSLSFLVFTPTFFSVFTLLGLPAVRNIELWEIAGNIRVCTS